MAMFELTGHVSTIAMTYGSSKPSLFIEVDEDTSSLFQMVDELMKHDKVLIKFDKFRKKRSLDANAYAWVLIGKIAEKTNVPKTEVYQNAIRCIGGNYEIVCVQDKALESLCQMWQRNGIGWVTDTMPSKIDGCTNVFLYYGSSVFTVDQMQRFIESIKQDCISLGIETKSQAEIDSLINSWGGKQ